MLERPLTISAVADDKVFDGSDTAVVTLSDNRIAGDALTILNSAANFADASLGFKVVYVSGITVTGADASNYTFNTAATTASASIFEIPTPVVSTVTNTLKNSQAYRAYSGEGERQVKEELETKSRDACNGTSVSEKENCGTDFSEVFPTANLSS